MSFMPAPLLPAGRVPFVDHAWTYERLPLREAAAAGCPRVEVLESRVRIPEAFEFLFEPARYKAVHGGRGSAKSHSIAAALLQKGHARPIRVLCCREVQRSIKDSVKRLLDDKIQEMRFSDFYSSTDAEIRGANGTAFIFAGLRTDPYKIKSIEGLDLAWVEEANTVSQTSLDLLTPTVRGVEDEEGAGLGAWTDDDGFRPGDPEIWFSWNPRRRTDPVDRMFRGDDGAPPFSRVVEVSWRDNPWFPRVLRAELEYDRRVDPAKYRHVWEGAYWERHDALVFSSWRVGSDLEFNPPPDVRYTFGADWGFAVDPTVLVRSYLVEDNPDGWELERARRRLFVDHEAWAVGCEIEDTPALFRGVPGADRGEIVADSSRPETISHVRRNGFPRLRAARKGPGSVEDGVAFLQSIDEIVVHPRCRRTADELATYSYKTDPLTGEVLPRLQDAKNHAIDALRYAHEGHRATSGFYVV